MPTLVFTPPASTSASASHTRVGAIVGGVIGGLVALVLIPLIIFFWLRRRKSKENLNLESEGKPESVSLVHLSAFLMGLYLLGSGSQIRMLNRRDKQFRLKLTVPPWVTLQFLPSNSTVLAPLRTLTLPALPIASER